MNKPVELNVKSWKVEFQRYYLWKLQGNKSCNFSASVNVFPSHLDSKHLPPFSTGSSEQGCEKQDSVDMLRAILSLLWTDEEPATWTRSSLFPSLSWVLGIQWWAQSCPVKLAVKGEVNLTQPFPRSSSPVCQKKDLGTERFKSCASDSDVFLPVDNNWSQAMAWQKKKLRS